MRIAIRAMTSQLQFHLNSGLHISTSTIPAAENTSGQFPGYILTEPVNVGSAWLRGFEIAYIQRLSFLPGGLRALGISANYSYTDSQASGLQALSRTDHPPLLRQAPHTWNISPTYDRGRVSIRVGMTYNDRSIYAYQFTDGAMFLESRVRLEIRISIPIFKWTLREVCGSRRALLSSLTGST